MERAARIGHASRISHARRIATVALIALCLALPAQAQEAKTDKLQGVGEAQIVIDTNLFCDTQEQVERFIALFNENQGNAEAAIAGVNAENKSADACLIATAAYQRGEDVGTIRSNDITFNVARILVVGVVTMNGLEAATPLQLFTLIPQSEGTVGRR